MKILKTHKGPMIVKPKPLKLPLVDGSNNSPIFTDDNNQQQTTMFIEPGYAAMCWKCVRHLITSPPHLIKTGEIDYSCTYLKDQRHSSFLARIFIKKEHERSVMCERCNALGGILDWIVLPVYIRTYKEAENYFINNKIYRNSSDRFKHMLSPPRYLEYLRP